MEHRINAYEGGKNLHSVVAFLDILGFSSAIAEARDQSSEDQLLGKLQDAIREARPYLSDRLNGLDNIKGVWESRFFTDNLVLGIPVFEDAEMELGSSFLMAGLYQFVLAQHGFFVRGAISVGPLFIDENVVFGSGLLEAHEIGVTSARDPRIVLAPSALKRVQRHLCYYGRLDESPQDYYLLEDVDNQVFVNYLAIPFIEDGPSAEYWTALENHKRRIEDNLTKYQQQPRIWSKYAWVAGYHNFTCEKICADPSPYRIGPEFLQPSPRLLHEVYQRNGYNLVHKDTGTTVASWNYRVHFKRSEKKE
jgi:hypothetical protein